MVDLLDEVSEDLRRERFNRYWNKVGGYVVAASIVIVLGTVATVAWQSYTKNRQQDAAAAFFVAEQDSRAQRNAEAAEKFAAVAERNAQGFTALAHMREAFALAKANDVDGALAAYGKVISDRKADTAIRSLARIHSASLMAVSDKSVEEVKAMLAPLADDRKNPFSAFAREQMAFAALAQGDTQTAHATLAALASDMQAPASLRRRAQAQLALVPAIADEEGALDGAQAAEISGEAGSLTDGNALQEEAPETTSADALPAVADDTDHDEVRNGQSQTEQSAAQDGAASGH